MNEKNYFFKSSYNKFLNSNEESREFSSKNNKTENYNFILEDISKKKKMVNRTLEFPLLKKDNQEFYNIEKFKQKKEKKLESLNELNEKEIKNPLKSNLKEITSIHDSFQKFEKNLNQVSKKLGLSNDISHLFDKKMTIYKKEASKKLKILDKSFKKIKRNNSVEEIDSILAFLQTDVEKAKRKKNNERLHFKNYLV